MRLKHHINYNPSSTGILSYFGNVCKTRCSLVITITVYITDFLAMTSFMNDPYHDKAELMTYFRPSSYFRRKCSRFISSSMTDIIAPRLYKIYIIVPKSYLKVLTYFKRYFRGVLPHFLIGL